MCSSMCVHLFVPMKARHVTFYSILCFLFGADAGSYLLIKTANAFEIKSTNKADKGRACRILLKNKMSTRTRISLLNHHLWAITMFHDHTTLNNWNAILPNWHAFILKYLWKFARSKFLVGHWSERVSCGKTLGHRWDLWYEVSLFKFGKAP